ncbi:MAG: phosphohydrolase [Chitinophagaceae bacterium]|nr:phosphohydrolase [Chitinophagaceae bacterium]MBK7680149.1 phosphohydrolase [Chitinophagaceae bacterium]MBK9660786.1 phosphohydrolase [Chitinophagaceae bacterium]MBK9939974.1 phosphohydrolase [Chitinophagaceae bacterium]MBP6232715.1 phosphohydrolase [Chitinophagaceae bacterium]
MSDNQILALQEAQALVNDLLTNKLSKNIKFHTLQHTQEVVAACQSLADYHQLPEDDRFALILAAWFHDTGYTGGEAKDHEALSIKLATDFLTIHSASTEVRDKVIGCINATRIPQSPDNIIEKIICDADLFHLGTDDFKEKSRLLREEIIEFGEQDLPKKVWRRTNIRFLEGHKYFTPYGKEKLQPIKDQHLAELKQKEKNNDEMKPVKAEKSDKKDKLKEKGKSPILTPEAEEAKRKKDKEKEADRSIATVFRIMANNHMALSQMADSKANILISVNAIILSILIGNLIDKLQTDPNLQIPLALIAVVCVASIVFGILATRPNVSSGKFSHEDIASKRTNLLFFGNFHNASLEDYSWGMTEMLGDKNYMNSSMIKDNYFLGVVLAKKYKYLRIAYNIFMYGLILSILAFVVASMLPEATEVYTAG